MSYQDYPFLSRVNGQIVLIVPEHWKKAKDKGNGLREALERLWYYNAHCKLAAFVPHGIARHEDWLDLGNVLRVPPSEYPSSCANDGVAALNDWTSDGILICGPNQVGKSLLLTILTALKTLPCDPNWPLFSDGPEELRVKWRQWAGPKKWIVASYTWDNVKTLWNHIREWFPRNEIRQYAPGWGMYEGEKGKPLNLNFGDGRPKELPCACGSTIKFLCYKQEQCHWEGWQADGGSFDEQSVKERWIGWKRGTTARGDYTPFIMAMTGHCVEGRPDTGAGGWIKTEFWDGKNTQGMKLGRFQLSVDTTSDLVISKAKKQALWQQWCSPEVIRSTKDERAAVARYWGGWEEGGGLLFDSDCWDKRIHVIDPLWPDDQVPGDWTKFRVIDYGDNGVTCCSWFAVGPKFAVLYRLLYEKGLLVNDTCKRIIEMSHNNQVLQAIVNDEWRPGETYSMFTEETDKLRGEVYYDELLDSRSAGQNKQGPSLLDLMQRYGLTNLREANGQRDDIQIPRFKDWLRIDWNSEHPFNKNMDGTPVKGSAKLYVFSGRCEAAIDELDRCPLEYKKTTAMHFIDTGKYWASAEPCYMGDEGQKGKAEYDIEYEGTPFTGY